MFDNTCRERCLDDSDCPSANCFGDVCGDAIGTPCALDDYTACFGLECIDVDANLTTVEPYCTDSCIDLDFTPEQCPVGYVCQSSECRKQ